MGQGLTWASEVVVHDAGVDAVLVEVGGEPVLVLRPSMSFGAAVQAVMGVAPHMSADDAARLVRRAMPDAPNLDELLDFTAAACGHPHVPAPAPEVERAPSLARTVRGRMLRAVGGLSAAAVLGFGLSHLIHLNENVDDLQAQVAANTDARAPQLAAHVTPGGAAKQADAPGAPTAAQLDATRRAVERVLAARAGAQGERKETRPPRAQNATQDASAETPARGGTRNDQAPHAPTTTPTPTATTSTATDTTAGGETSASASGEADQPVTAQDVQAIVDAVLNTLATPPRHRERAHHGPAKAGPVPAVKPQPSKPDPVKPQPPKPAPDKSETVSIKETVKDEPGSEPVEVRPVAAPPEPPVAPTEPVEAPAASEVPSAVPAESVVEPVLDQQP